MAFGNSQGTPKEQILSYFDGKHYEMNTNTLCSSFGRKRQTRMDGYDIVKSPQYMTLRSTTLIDVYQYQFGTVIHSLARKHSVT